MNEDQKTARLVAFIASFIYLALFFASFYAFIFVPQLIGNPDMTGKIGIFLVFLSLLLPLSIVVSIALMWNRYLNQNWRGVYLSCCLPVATLIAIVVLMKFVQLVFL